MLRGVVRDGHFRTEGDTGMVPAPGAHAGDGMLVVRPEDARPDGEHPGSRMQGKVLSSAFQGRCWRLSLDVGAQRVRLDWPESKPVGATLAFSLPPERCVVLSA